MTKSFSKILIIFAATIILASCENAVNSNSQINKTPSTTKSETQIIFDVSSLVGKNIDEVRKALGKPTDKDIEPTKTQLKMNINDWDNSFSKDGYSLLVTFNPRTRKAIDYFIGTKDSSGMADDYSDLLKTGNVTNDNSKYMVQPVPAIKDNSKYTGIKVVPK